MIDESEVQIYFQGYLSHLTNERRLSTLTCENYARDVRQFLTLKQDTPLQQLQIHQVRRYVATLHARGLSGKTLARMLSSWRSFFKYLARDHQFTHNPCLGLRAPKSPKNLPHALSPDEAGKLMAIATDTDPLSIRDKAIFELFYLY